MRRIARALLIASCALMPMTPVLAAAARAQENRAETINRIIDQGLNHSEAMLIAHHLTDRIGGRMTNSPAMRAAERWTADRFRAWGLANVRAEPFRFGRGWEILSSRVTLVSPRPLALTAIPVAWTPPTPGTVRAPVIVAPIKRERDFAAWKGRLAGRIVMISLPGTGDEPNEAPFRRLSDSDLAGLDRLEPHRHDPAEIARQLRRASFDAKLDAFLKAEGAVAWVRRSYRDGKLVHGEGYGFARGATPSLPGIELAAEDYRRVARLAQGGEPPVLEILSDVRFDDSDENAYNIIAEVPGTDPAAGYVMAGAHLDSWVAADGAADNAAGVAAVMEAARILKTLGIRPKRTIRFALWAGEEQALLGSLAYVNRHLASWPPMPEGMSGDEVYYRAIHAWPITRKPGAADLAAYFNIDNGAGRIRGIHAEHNVGAVPLLRDWLAPFASLGAGQVAIARTGGTDHVFMQRAGLPGFQFIQDPLDYDSRIHHTNADTFDHLKGDDLRQAATVLAGMLFQAADSAERLPAMPAPTEPVATDPFKVEDPDNAQD
ncbi:M20/M25/M40 family metallo-hydrolase [Sphingomonas changnyeongensis]|uniref:Carboxypeptidase Q n=2 Tax=Sphingomonas changnyeongensis TaxID=2698679 RepID=A0A7Z2NV26_9SPHN|nr:M20/M25/M40 family metallo-hydrolase [Sphingomonas changnyeongensis]